MSFELINFAHDVLCGMYANAAYQGLSQLLGSFESKMKGLAKDKQHRGVFNSEMQTLLEQQEGLLEQLAELHTQFPSLIQIINQNHYHSGLSEDDARALEHQYLCRISNDCGGLEWLSQMELEDGHSPVLQLDAVYTPQQVVEREHFEHVEELQAKHSDREPRQLSAVELLNREQHLVLSGAAGSGKSALVNYLLLCMAGEVLGKPTLNLNALTEAMPDEDGDAQQQAQPWDHGFLIPLRVILRDFATSEQFPTTDEQGDACYLMDFIEAELKRWRLEDFIPVLKGRLQQGMVLLLLDGLDEVPQANQRRDKLIQCIQGIQSTYSHCRLLVTCRPYAYQQKQWQLARFADGTLAEFHSGQIRLFVKRWYQQLHLTRTDGDRDDFIKAIFERDSLRELAKRPLLLSLCAYLNARQYELPQRRAELYSVLIDLLVNKWEKARYQVKASNQALEIEQYGLADFLNIRQDDIQEILKRRAFVAHASQPETVGTADIPGKELVNELVNVSRIDSTATEFPKQLHAYLRDRVGILSLRSAADGRNAIYSFPHRSFQEYLTAAYFSLEENDLFELIEAQYPGHEWHNWRDLLAFLGQNDPQRWREVVLLAASMKVRSEPTQFWDLLEALCVAESEDQETRIQQQHWGLRLVAEILSENSDDLPITRQRRASSRLATIVELLPQIISSAYLPARERVEAGKLIARLPEHGDPRIEVMDVDAMPFCLIPKGSFWMGAAESDNDAYDDEKPGTEYNLDDDYWLARYPVTVAQFKQFVEQSDYKLGNDDNLKGVSNEPVVRISWHEAMAFCDWLQNRWQDKGWLPAGLRVTLPNEPEWEKAARGAEWIPETSLQTCISELSVTDPTLIAKQLKNPHPQQRYPWGEAIDAEHCNFAKSIGQTATPGAYPIGCSPYGCEDMSGNIWEWTRNQFHDYPYPPVFSKDWWKRESPDNAASRVLRGGAFYNYQYGVRLSYRLNYRPGIRYDYIGFRVCLSPLPLDADPLNDGSLNG